jgi:hypothetical protein
MIIVPFLCCNFLTTELQFNADERKLFLSIYIGFFSCCSKDYAIPFGDIIDSKLMVVFNHRINKRQAFRLYLETRIGDFELTFPKSR